ncbi:inhibin beta C chain-like [Parasteatoda tepidariorum]|uniref:inhibin beta C chain-like n=1 Tax=Parasteatoda tepidariorum TaxID=114398 RepID=UPI001C71A3A7|nr:inhibin beta C chain-like [Parasteatoda tepidariorum]
MSFRILISFVFASFVYLLAEINARPKGVIDRYKTDINSAPIVLNPNVIREMKEYKLKVLKLKILREINLTAPPMVQTPVRVPRNFLKLFNKTVDEIEYDDNEELIEDPINDDFDCVVGNDTECTRFEFELAGENRTINSIHIWFQKITPNESLHISVRLCSSMDIDDQNCTSNEILQEVKTDLGWTSFEISPKLLSQYQNKYRFCSVEAYGTNFEIQGNRQPFLVATLNAAAERKRRSTRTAPNKICTNQCCKIDFYISFKEIGWNFVVYPEGFYANMCYGKCSNEDQNAFPSHYHRILNLALTNKTSTAENKEPVWTPCCSPTELKPLEMIYKASNDTTTNSTHTLVHHEIPNMIAESCGCW